MRFRDDRVLSLDMMVVVKVHDDPVVRALEPVRVGSVGVEGGEMPIAPQRVQYGKPIGAVWVEALGRDGRQAAGLGFAAISPCF